MSLIELKVPDIGGHENVDIIAVEVNVGDTIAVDDTLITLETDKATMDVPAEVAGVVKEVKVKVGDKISEGGLIAVVEAEGAAAAPKAEAPAAPAQESPKAAAPAPQAAQFGGSADAEYDVVVLGGGPGGYSAAFAAADEGLKVAIVERYKTLGGVCLNVGCIPSKALLHNAAVIDEVRHLAANGIKYPEPELDIDMLRGYKDGVVSRLTTGLAGMAKGRKVDIIQGDGQFLDPHHLEVSLTTSEVYEQATPTGEKKIVAFKNCIIAAGSRVGANAPKEPQRYDAVLVAAGRAPNGKLISAEKAGVAVTDRGFIEVDKQMRTNVPHIYAIGDIVGQPMLAHKAVHEGHVAAENCAGHKAYFDARVIPGVAYTSPEVAWVGETELSAKASGRKITKANFPWAASGRAIANGCDTGFTKLIFDAETGRIIGGGIVGPNGGDMIGEICLAIEMGCDAEDIGKTIHPHPTLGESIGMAAEVALGTCTDLPAQKKK